MIVGTEKSNGVQVLDQSQPRSNKTWSILLSCCPGCNGITIEFKYWTAYPEGKIFLFLYCNLKLRNNWDVWLRRFFFFKRKRTFDQSVWDSLCMTYSLIGRIWGRKKTQRCVFNNTWKSRGISCFLTFSQGKKKYPSLAKKTPYLST